MFELAQDSLIFIQEGIKVTAFALTSANTNPTSFHFVTSEYPVEYVLWKWSLNVKSQSQSLFHLSVFGMANQIHSTPNIYPNPNRKDKFNSLYLLILEFSFRGAISSILNTTEIFIIGNCTLPVNSLLVVLLIITYISKIYFYSEFMTDSYQLLTLVHCML